MKIETKLLKSMLDKAMKGVKSNKIIPITNLIGIKSKSGKFSITATDLVNFIEVTEKVKSEDFEVTVPAVILNRLIQKMTTKEVDLILKDDYLEVVGNGKYKIQLPLEEDELVKYPEMPKLTATEKGTIKFTDVQKIISSNKPCISNQAKKPYLCGFHCSDLVVTTDENKAALSKVKLFENAFLMCEEAVELLSVVECDEIHYIRNADKIKFKADNILIFTVEMENEQDHPGMDLDSFFDDLKENSYCKLPKQDLIDILDRISLFVSSGDDKSIELTFTKTYLSVKSRQDTGSERIKYEDSKNVQDFSCLINFELLRDIISSQTKGVFNLYFGDNTAIKIIDEDCKYLVTLLHPDSESIPEEEISDEVDEY